MVEVTHGDSQFWGSPEFPHMFQPFLGASAASFPQDVLAKEPKNLHLRRLLGAKLATEGAAAPAPAQAQRCGECGLCRLAEDGGALCGEPHSSSFLAPESEKTSKNSFQKGTSL